MQSLQSGDFNEKGYYVLGDTGSAPFGATVPHELVDRQQEGEMTDTHIRLAALAGLLGACAMLIGDLLFYGQWGSGADALRASLDIVQEADPDRLIFGGLMSGVGGLGYALGVLHVFSQLSARPVWLRRSVAFSFLAMALIAATTHAVWASFALAIVGGAPRSVDLIGSYLNLHFMIGGLVGAPASILLAAAILFRASKWPVWFALINPGAIYLVLSSASYLPAPLGAGLVGGAFNLAFAIFYGISLIVSFTKPSGVPVGAPNRPDS